MSCSDLNAVKAKEFVTTIWAGCQCDSKCNSIYIKSKISFKTHMSLYVCIYIPCYIRILLIICISTDNVWGNAGVLPNAQYYITNEAPCKPMQFSFSDSLHKFLYRKARTTLPQLFRLSVLRSSMFCRTLNDTSYWLEYETKWPPNKAECIF